MVRFKMKLSVLLLLACALTFLALMYITTNGKQTIFCDERGNRTLVSKSTFRSQGDALPSENISIKASLVSSQTHLKFTDNNTKIYLERKRLIGRVCRKNIDLDEPLVVKKAKLDHILVDEEHKVLFCYVPKVACTNWKRVLMVLMGKTPNVTEALSKPAFEIHSKNLFSSLQNYTSTAINRIIESYTKFIFVRNPFERLLSAYRNKLEQHYHSSKYFQARFGKYIVKNFRKNPSNESLAKGDDVTFAEFVKYLLQSDQAGYNEHWQTVTELCQPCFINYDFVGKYETLSEDSEFVLKQLELNLTFPTLAKPSTTAASVVKYYSTIDRDVVMDLYKIYGLDFKMFGYDLYKSLEWS